MMAWGVSLTSFFLLRNFSTCKNASFHLRTPPQKVVVKRIHIEGLPLPEAFSATCLLFVRNEAMEKTVGLYRV